MGISIFQIGVNKTKGVPNFVDKIAVATNAFGVKV